MRIKISSCGHHFYASLSESITAKKIWNALPIRGELSWWGKEIYFDIPLVVEKENPQRYVELGSIAYWPEGPGFCIFFGHTPINKERIQPASPVNVFGTIEDFPIAEQAAKSMKGGSEIIIERA